MPPGNPDRKHAFYIVPCLIRALERWLELLFVLPILRVLFEIDRWAREGGSVSKYSRNAAEHLHNSSFWQVNLFDLSEVSRSWHKIECRICLVSSKLLCMWWSIGESYGNKKRKKNHFCQLADSMPTYVKEDTRPPEIVAFYFMPGASHQPVGVVCTDITLTIVTLACT
jgi:hypothetical protein